MRLFVWNKYFPGLGVAAADTVEEARALITAVGKEPGGQTLLRIYLQDEPDEILDLPAAVYCPGGG